MLEKVEGKITNGQSTGNRTKTKTKQNKHKRTTPKTKTIINTDPTKPRG